MHCYLSFTFLPSSIVFMVTDCFAISTSTSKISPSELCSLIEGIYKRRTVIFTQYSTDFTSFADTNMQVTFIVSIASEQPCDTTHFNYLLLESTVLSSLILMFKKD